MCDALKRTRLGQILDFVPNHMGVGGADNPLWLDVLEWGADSPYAGWFDIDWDPERRYLRNKILVPLLGDQYGIELERGVLRLQLRCQPSRRASRSGHTTPTSCRSARCITPRILGDAQPRLEQLARRASLAAELAAADAAARGRILKRELAALVRERADVRAALERRARRFNAGEASQPRLARLRRADRAAALAARAFSRRRRRHQLPPLLQHQRSGRPAHRGAGSVRSRASPHASSWSRTARIDGLRIDHIDGLFDPKSVSAPLQRAAGPRGLPDGHSIWSSKRSSRRTKGCARTGRSIGTTGYDFIEPGAAAC